MPISTGVKFHEEYAIQGRKLCLGKNQVVVNLTLLWNIQCLEKPARKHVL